MLTPAKTVIPTLIRALTPIQSNQALFRIRVPSAMSIPYLANH